MARGEAFIKIKMTEIIINLAHIVLYATKITMIQITVEKNVKNAKNIPI